MDLSYGGHVLRMATHELDVGSSNGDLHYVGTCDPMVYQRAIDLFSRQAEEDSIAVECRAPADVPTLASQGHRLDGSRVQVSQVRVRVDGAGVAAVDDYEDRRVLLTGTVRDAEYGPYAQGSAALRFSVLRRLKRTRAKVPATWEAVSATTWPTTYLRGEDLGISYPVVIGYPGRDTRSQDGFIPAWQSVYARRQYLYQVLVAGLGTLDATTMRICTEADTIGTDVTLTTTYRDYEAAATVEALDRLDQRVTVVDYHDQGYYIGGASELTSSYHADAADKDETPIHCALTQSGGGGMLVGGKVLRGAGDVIVWLLERAGVPVDAGSASVLNCYFIDAVIAESVAPLDWLREELLPLLPVSLVDGEAGVRVVGWAPGRGPADATFDLDADANPLLWPAERMQETDSTANHFTLRYGWNQLSKRYRYTTRVGPKAVESGDQASVVIRSQGGATATYAGVRIQFIQAGSAGVGWTVTCTDTGVEGVTVTTALRLIAVTFDGGATTSSTLAATLNAAAGFAAIATAPPPSPMTTAPRSPGCPRPPRRSPSRSRTSAPPRTPPAAAPTTSGAGRRAATRSRRTSSRRGSSTTTTPLSASSMCAHGSTQAPSGGRASRVQRRTLPESTSATPAPTRTPSWRHPICSARSRPSRSAARAPRRYGWCSSMSRLHA
ncbi:hypothetical protein [Janthinobacterium sp.]|uniref:hypothetical protein n=1 Tax=Janthinobacterium sp. TaxID=1871054 RepID=UPI0025B97BD8|nr:hypothetical protein [Janthinobacterium sp.]